MKIFKCPKCREFLYFENYSCLGCGTRVGFDIISKEFINIDTASSSPICANRQSIGCNWLTDLNHLQCRSCRLTSAHPESIDLNNFSKYRLLEKAKRRLIFQLNMLSLPIISKFENYQTGLEFEFLDKNNSQGKLTGHHQGTITILLEEADSVQREQLRKKMSEPYRTLVGHFRHEVGHYYWLIFINNGRELSFRQVFGDERIDYATSLESHYQNGAPSNWPQHYISQYASSHPMEDWAESWAHYLHIMDMLQTAHHSGITVKSIDGNKQAMPYADIDPYQQRDFRTLYQNSISLTNGVNNLNRSMGIPDIYPFVIPDPVYHKLEFIHELLQSI